MAKRSLQLDESEVGEAVADYIKSRYPEMWKPGTLEVILWSNTTSTLTVTWKIVEPEKED